LSDGDHLRNGKQAFKVILGGRATVTVTILLHKLIEIEKSIGIEADRTILHKIRDAENCLLELQKETLQNRFPTEPKPESMRRHINLAFCPDSN
jgi:hypothetical protein